MTKLTDSELIDLARKDDEVAKEELFERCKDVISYHVVKYKGMYYGKLNKFDVEDLVSECHIAVMEAIKLYNPQRGAGFAHFSKFIIRTRILRFLNKGIEEAKNIIADTKLEFIKAPQDIRQKLFIKTKNEREQKIVDLYLKGMTQQEISREIGISHAGVRKTLLRCIK